MTQQPADEAFRRLFAGRADAMPLTNKMQRRLGTHGQSELEAIAGDDRESPGLRRAASLLAAMRYLEQGDKSRMVDVHVLMRFFLRHIEISLDDPGQPEDRRQAFQSAAEHIKVALGDPIKGSPAHAAHSSWRESMGMGEGQFIQLASHALGLTIESIDPAEIPNWLEIERASEPDPFICSTASWNPSDLEQVELDLQDQLNTAWAAYRDGTLALSNELLSPLRDRVGTDWGPGVNAESRHLWNWVRFTHELVATKQATEGKRRRMLSTASLFGRLAPAASGTAREEAAWLEPQQLAEEVMRDLRPGDPDVETLMAVYSARLAALIQNHEPVIANLSNPDRARLRRLWRDRFKNSLRPGATSTHELFISITDALESVLENVAECPRAARDESWDHFYRLARQARPFCDPLEADLLDESINLVHAIDDHEKRSVWVLGDLEDFGTRLEKVSRKVRASGSVFVQEAVLPFLRAGGTTIARATAIHEDQEPVEVRITLEQRRYPIFGHPGRGFEVSFTVVNRGEIDATNLTLRLACEELSFEPDETTFAAIQPGSAREATFVATVLKQVEDTSIRVETSWTDEFERQYQASDEFPIESERASRWTDDVVNPFSLNAIDAPARLVGRSAELGKLKQLAVSGQSTYVTGHKRIGKTSLVRVLVRTLRSENVASSRITLGQAISETPSASQLAYAVLDAANRAIAATWSIEMSPPSYSSFSENFALEGGRWMTQLSDSVPADGRVIVAIDDFDELPDALVTGDEGDALFRFLRSLVEEPWLSLIFVGSEVLPAIITGRQGVKLNTVSQTTLFGFSSPSATYELLESASGSYLDWDEDALARIHALSSGNPYYATLIGAEVWNQMHLENRTLVNVADVDGAVERTVGVSSDSHFVHYWSDGPSGLDIESEVTIASAAVLRGTALSAGGEAGGWAASGSVTATALQYLASATRGSVEDALRLLVNRGVLTSNSEGTEVRIVVPLLAAWLRGPGGRAVMDRLFSASHLGLDTAFVVPPGEILELAEDWFYQDTIVNELRIQAWLDQFDEGQDRFIAFQLLRELRFIGYFDSSRMERDVWPKLATSLLADGAGQYQKLSGNKKGGRQYRENFYLLGRRRQGTSADIANRHMAASLRIKKTANSVAIDRLDRVLEAGRRNRAVLFVVDDFAGTGNQAREIRDDLTKALGALDPAWRDKVLIALGLGVVTDADVIRSLETDGVMASFGMEVPTTLKLSEGGPESLSPDLAERARDLFSAVGRQLVPDAPMGYGGHGMLVSFADNCPNNSIPAFWSHGEVGGKRWIPLLARRQ